MSAPQNLAGYMDTGSLGLDGYGAIVDYLLEQVPQMQHPLSVRTFAQMRHEPQLAAILRVYTLALTRAAWSIDGAGCDPAVTRMIADDLGLPVKGQDEPQTGARRRRFTWAKHLRTVAPLSLTFGHAPFAQQWTLIDGKYRLAVIQERMPQTIAELKFHPDGTLRGCVQEMTTGNSKAPAITTDNHQLVWYAREREGSNYYGQSLLRPSYEPWLIKDQVMRVWATSNRRNGMGVWQINAPQGATPQQMAEAQRMASSTRAGETAGQTLPYGFTGKLTGMSGSLPDHNQLALYLDRQMTRSTLTSILDMATAERGSRSLGETVMQMMIYAQQAEGQRIAEDATEQIIIPLVDANFGEVEPAPQVVVDDIGMDDQLTAQDLNWLLQYGGLTPDDVLEEHTRQRYGLPPIDDATRRFEITTQPETEPDPNDPNEPTEPQEAP